VVASTQVNTLSSRDDEVGRQRQLEAAAHHVPRTAAITGIAAPRSPGSRVDSPTNVRYQCGPARIPVETPRRRGSVRPFGPDQQGPGCGSAGLPHGPRSGRRRLAVQPVLAVVAEHDAPTSPSRSNRITFMVASLTGHGAQRLAQCHQRCRRRWHCAQMVDRRLVVVCHTMNDIAQTGSPASGCGKTVGTSRNPATRGGRRVARAARRGRRGHRGRRRASRTRLSRTGAAAPGPGRAGRPLRRPTEVLPPA